MPKPEPGTKISFTYDGVAVTGWVLQPPFPDSNRVPIAGEPDASDPIFSVVSAKMRDVVVLERSRPADNWPVGTVIRYGESASSKKLAIKEANGQWYVDGVFITWATLADYRRPLTVFTPTKVIE